MATYAKLRDGSWGVRVQGGGVEPGETVTVTKKSGETKVERIGRVLWNGDGISLCTLAASQPRYNSGCRDDAAVYCYGPCPVTGLKCCAKNGPCHDCQ
jgi:hypothetical protein